MNFSVDIGDIHIPLYWIMIMTGIGTSVIVVIKHPYVNTLNRDDILYSMIYGTVGVLIGAKLLYLITVTPQIIVLIKSHRFTTEILLALFGGGFVFFGGLIGGIVGVWIYARQYKIDFRELVETLTPGVPLIHAFGRIGCFFAGCCYGLPVRPPFGFMLNDSPIAPHDIYLLPVQLIESLFNFALFAWIYITARKHRTKKNLLCLYLIVYSSGRFIIEYFRYDAARGEIGALSTSQWICILILIATAIILIREKTPNPLTR